MRNESRFRALFRRSRMEQDMADEFEFHIEQRAHELQRRGLSPADAERQARLELGAAETFKEQCREAKGLRFIDELKSDVRFALRSLRRSRLFTAVAIVTLALGIAVTTSIFSVLDHVLLRPFPFAGAERLVLVWTRNNHDNAKYMNAYPLYQALRARQDVFDGMGALWPTVYYVRGSEYPDRFSGRRATASLFETLGVQAQLGRLFTANEERVGHDDVVVLSDSCWTRRFGRDPNVIGRVIWLRRNNRPQRAHTIIGVLPKELESAFPRYSEMWGPIARDSEDAASHAGAFEIIARLKSGVSIADTTPHLEDLMRRLAAEDPKNNKWKTIELENLHSNLTGGYVQQMLPVLMGAVLFVLLLACVNVLNLMLARGAGREREIATRASLGAGPLRLFRQLMTESVVLAVLRRVYRGGCRVACHRCGAATSAGLRPAARRDLPGCARAALHRGNHSRRKHRGRNAPGLARIACFAQPFSSVRPFGRREATQQAACESGGNGDRPRRRTPCRRGIADQHVRTAAAGRQGLRPAESSRDPE